MKVLLSFCLSNVYRTLIRSYFFAQFVFLQSWVGHQYSIFSNALAWETHPSLWTEPEQIEHRGNLYWITLRDYITLAARKINDFSEFFKDGKVQKKMYVKGVLIFFQIWKGNENINLIFAFESLNAFNTKCDFLSILTS